MFCPKCGAQLPDGSAFCSKCGVQIKAPANTANTAGAASPANAASAAPAQTAAVAQPASASATPSVTPGAARSQAKAPSAGGFATIQIAALAAAVLALIFALLPWFESSDLLLAAGAASSTLGDIGSMLTGRAVSSMSFDESYSVFGFPGLAGMITQNGWGAAGAPFMIVFALWLIGFIVLAIGAVLLVLHKKPYKPVMIAGGIIMALVAIIWIFSYGGLTSYAIAKGAPVFAILCFIASLAAVGCAIASKPAAGASK